MHCFMALKKLKFSQHTTNHSSQATNHTATKHCRTWPMGKFFKKKTFESFLNCKKHILIFFKFVQNVIDSFILKVLLILYLCFNSF